MRRRVVLAAVAGGGLAAAPAATAQELTASARFSPDRAGAPSGMTVSFTARGGDRPPDAFSVTTPDGLRLDPRAVATRCSDAAAADGACPAASRIGSGEVQAATILGTFTFRGSAFLGVPRSGEHASVWLALEGFSGAVRASVRRAGDAYVLRLADLVGERPGGGSAIPPGAVRQVSGTFRVEARSRTVLRTRRVRVRGKRRTRRVRTTHHLLRNPATCPAGGWRGRVEITTGGARREVPVVAPCSPAR